MSMFIPYSQQQKIINIRVWTSLSVTRTHVSTRPLALMAEWFQASLQFAFSLSDTTNHSQGGGGGGLEGFVRTPPAFILNLLQRVEICKAVTPPANTHNNQNVRACQRQRSRGGRLDRKHGCITVCDRPGHSTSGVARTTGSVAISCNDLVKDIQMNRHLSINLIIFESKESTSVTIYLSLLN